MTTTNESTNAIKRNRRGITNETRATAQLKFHEKDASKQNFLFVGHLHEVTVDYRTLSDDTKGLQSFAGMAVPRLTFHFASNHNKDAELRHVYQTLMPVESNVETIPGGSKEWQVNRVMSWIKHILDVYYLKGRELTDAECDALTLNFVDFDESEDGNCTYNPDLCSTEDVLNSYRVLFENAAAMLNGTFGENATNKPVYKSATGSYIPTWIKLLRHKKVKGEWTNVASNGELAFDSFIGEGVIELINGTNPPTVLHVDVSKESITPKEIRKAPTIGGMNTPFGGVAVPDSNTATASPFNNAFAEAADNMPF